MHDRQALLLFLTLFLFPSLSLSWWDLSFDYRFEINFTGAVLSDHQVLLILNGTNFNYSHAPDADLRFVNSSNSSLPYWIESWNPGGESRVWLRVDSIPSLVTLYYGSPSASNQSDGPATFELFDDFSAGKSANWISNFGPPSSWQVQSGYISLVDSNPGPKEVLYHNQPVPNDIEVYSRIYMDTGMNSNKQANIIFRYTDIPSDKGNGYDARYDSDRSKFEFDKLDGGAWSEDHGEVAHTISAYTWHEVKVQVLGSNFYAFIKESGSWVSLSSWSDPDFASGMVGFSVWDEESRSRWDDLRVRKLFLPEPPYSFLTEEESLPPLLSIQSPSNSTYYTNATGLIPLNFTALDPTGVSSCKYELNSVNHSLPSCSNTTLQSIEGPNSLKVWASEIFGNWNFSSVQFTRATPPNITMDFPTSGSHRVDFGNILLNFTASDDSGVASCVYELNSVNTTISCVNQSISVPDGPNSLRLWVMDVFSNWASSPLVSFTTIFNDFISVVVDSNNFGYAEAEFDISPLEAPMRIMIGPTGRMMDQKRLYVSHPSVTNISIRTKLLEGDLPLTVIPVNFTLIEK